MIRKIATAIMTVALVMAFPSTAHATSASSETIPVSGYIGANALAITPGEIYVEVPVQLVFAAFESDAGIVTSPQYTIKNLSADTDVKVTLESFTQTNAESVLLDDLLSLKLLTPAYEDLLTGIYPQAEPQALVLTERLPKLEEGSTDNELGFCIGGTWHGAFDTEAKPDFEMVLTFTIVK